MQGVIADFTNFNHTQPHGVVAAGNCNAIDNVLMTGASGTTPLGANQVAYPSRLNDSARNNYASLFAYHTPRKMRFL